MKKKEYYQYFQDIDTCRYFLKHLIWGSAGDFIESTATKIERRLNDLKISLMQIFMHRQFKSIQNWIDLVINVAKEKFKENFYFTNIYLMNSEHFFNEIKELIDTIGIPLVFNNKEECATILPKNLKKNEFIQLYTINKFMFHVEKIDIQCPLLKFCKNNDPHTMNEYCINSPITKLNKTIAKLCPFSLFLKSYGLDKIGWV